MRFELKILMFSSVFHVAISLGLVENFGPPRHDFLKPLAKGDRGSASILGVFLVILGL